MTDIVERLEILAAMIRLGDRIHFGSDSAAMDEAAYEIERLRAENKRLYEICRSYCDPFNMRVEDWQYLGKLMENESRGDMGMTAESTEKSIACAPAPQPTGSFALSEGLLRVVSNVTTGASSNTRASQAFDLQLSNYVRAQG